MQQEKLATELFGAETAADLNNISLNDEKDFVNFAKLVHSKIATAKSRNFQVSFVSELIRALEGNLRAEDFQAIQQKANVLYNSKLKAEKGKEKKKAKGDVIRTHFGKRNQRRLVRGLQG